MLQRSTIVGHWWYETRQQPSRAQGRQRLSRTDGREHASLPARAWRVPRGRPASISLSVCADWVYTPLSPATFAVARHAMPGQLTCDNISPAALHADLLLSIAFYTCVPDCFLHPIHPFSLVLPSLLSTLTFHTDRNRHTVCAGSVHTYRRWKHCMTLSIHEQILFITFLKFDFRTRIPLRPNNNTKRIS